jgi:hypothetical protein
LFDVPAPDPQATRAGPETPGTTEENELLKELRENDDSEADKDLDEAA